MQNHNQYSQTPDEDLVNLAQRGDNNAFAELIQRHYNSCSKLALSILRDKSDAEDEVQNACWKAFEHIDQFQKDAKFSTWLTRIVVNQCLMRLRQARRAKFLYMDDPLPSDESLTFQLADTGETPEEELGKSEVAAVLNTEISRIPPLLRKAFVLRDVNRLPIEDVAKELGISVAAAKSRLLRARQELRERMSKHYGYRGAATLLA